MKRMLVPLLLIHGLWLSPVQATDPPGGGIRLRCGGIGDEESEPMRAEAGRHALMILFADAGGSWITDVAIRIEDPFSGAQAEALCGPIALVDVPAPGRHRIVATYLEQSQERWLNLKPAAGSRLVLRWAQ